METIDADLAYARCGYNLRTLPRDGACPECGEAVVASEVALNDSLAPLAQIRARGSRWMRTIREAATIATIAWLIFGFDLFTQSSRNSSRPSTLVTPVASSVLACWAAWRLFTPRRNVFNSIGRVAVAATLVTFIASAIDYHWVRFYFPKTGRLPWPLGDWTLDLAETLVPGLPFLFWSAFTFVFARLAFLCRLARRHVLMAGTTVIATAPVLWLIPFWPRLSEVGLGIRWWMVVNTLLFCGLAFVPITLGSLIVTFTRAIALGELPAASSRPSPSPRSPA